MAFVTTVGGESMLFDVARMTSWADDVTGDT